MRVSHYIPVAIAVVVFHADSLAAAQSTATTTTFQTEEIMVAASNVQLAGTLYVPKSELHVPAVVFVHGAGPAVRSDGYRELAEHFAGRGVAALIYDKRGCGAS